MMQFNDNVNELLDYLSLNEYLENFHKRNIHTIECLKGLWEIELITVSALLTIDNF